MVPFSVKIKRFRPAELMQREWNGIKKQAMHKAGELWIKEFLPLHFEPGAVQRYGYESRSTKYNRSKRRAQRVKSKGGAVPAPKPPAPLVWTGELKKQVLSRPVDQFNIKATATSKKAKVRVPVKIPHPLNPVHAGEITRFANDEAKAMNKVAVDEARRLIGELSTRTTTKIKG